MSRSHRDNQRRLDHIHGLVWRENYYGRHLRANNDVNHWASKGNYIWRSVPRYSQGRRQFQAGLKRLKRHLLKENRMHDRLYGHHPHELMD